MSLLSRTKGATFERGDTRLPRRFWTKVEERGDCWEWIGARITNGYGVFRTGGAGSPMQVVHRTSYEALVGPIPEGLQLDHLCRNRACCYPGHMEPVSGRENVLRGVGITALNAAKTHCKNGHELVGRNVLRRPSRPTFRECRICNARMTRERQAAKRAESRRG